jgi:hypothetical protein
VPLLVAFDTAAAVLSFVVAELLVGPAFTDSSSAQSLAARDYGPLLVGCLQIALIAVLLAIPYSRWVSAAAGHVVRRAALIGPFYAASIVFVYALLLVVAVPRSGGDQNGASDLVIPVAALLVTSPYWLAGGLLFGSTHGLLARRFAHPSANAPIVTS